MSGLKAGAYKIEITPDEPVFLAGFGQNRRSTGIHDDLNARCLVVESNGARLGIVALDLIGLFNEDVAEIRGRCGIDGMILACTHVHSGPDTLGLWGPNNDESGVDERYVHFLKARVSECVKGAVSGMEHATLSLATINAPGISMNVRDSTNLDDEFLVAKLEGEGGGTIATLVNFASHPEVLGDHNTVITADFPGFACDIIEHELGGCAIYLNGAIGGMVTPDVLREDFESAANVGQKVASSALDALDHAELQEEPRVDYRRSAIQVPMENERFSELQRRGVLKRRLYDGRLKTEVTLARVGGAQFATIPGEAFPNLGLDLKRMMKARYKFVLGIAEDELGYIMQESDYRRKLYSYERSMSAGVMTWPIVKEALADLI